MTPVATANRTDIQTLITRLGKLADEKDWPGIKAIFASKVVLDYFDEPELLSSDDIVSRWRTLLPAFDQTHHDISNVDVREEHGRTLGTADVVGTHVIADDRWIIRGRYEFEVKSVAGKNVITRLRLVSLSSQGENVLKEAQKRAGIKPPEKKFVVEHVTFPSRGCRLVGWLLEPKRSVSDDVVVLGGTWTSVKEQMAYPYARLIAEKGYPVLVFDFAGFGESAGDARLFEDPETKIQNFVDAVGYVKSRPDFAAHRVTLTGICASAQYVAAAAGRDGRVQRLALISPWIHDRTLVEQTYGALPGYGSNGVDGRMKAGDAAGQRFRDSKQIDVIPAASSDDERAAMYFSDPKMIDFYLDEKRGNIPQWGNKMALMSWGPWLGFDGVSKAAGVKVPTLIVHSEKAAIPDGAKRFAEKLPASKKIHWIDGTQFDFYDNPEQMKVSVDLFVDFMKMGTH